MHELIKHNEKQKRPFKKPLFLETGFKKALTEELQTGRISPDIVEVLNIAVPEGVDRYNIDNLPQKEFETYIQSITVRLLDSEFAKKNLLKGDQIPKFRYLVSDYKNDINAGILKGSNPPIISFTSGLIKLIASSGKEDLLAAIIAHELTHYFSGTEKNSKVEESVAYALPRFLLYYGGYQHNALDEFFKNLHNQESIGNLFNLLDVHPGPTLTRRLISDSEGLLAQHLRRTKPGFKSIPLADASNIAPIIDDVANSFKFHNIIDEDFAAVGLNPYSLYVKSKAEKAELEPPETTRKKIELIKERFDDWLDINQVNLTSIGREVRLRQIKGILETHFGEYSKIKIDPTDVLAPLINHIIEKGVPISPVAFVAHLPRVRAEKNEEYFYNSSFFKIPEGTIISELSDSFKAVFALMENKDINIGDAHAVCGQLVEVMERIPKMQRKSLHYYFGDLPGLPSQGYVEGKVYKIWKKRLDDRRNSRQQTSGITAPWDRLVDMAICEFSENNTATIAEALSIIGIKDPRLIAVPQQKNLTEDFQYMRKLGFPHLMQDRDGKIIGNYKKWSDYLEHTNYSEESLAKHRKDFFDLDRDNAFVVGEIVQSDLEKLSEIKTAEDLYRILKLHPLQFAFPNRFLGGEYRNTKEFPGNHSAEALIERLGSLINENPLYWIPVIRTLLCHSHKITKNTLFNDSPISLLDLTQINNWNMVDNVLSGNHDFFQLDKEKIKIYYPEEIGVSITHPYITFILDHTQGIVQGEAVFFSFEEAISAFDQVTMVSHTQEGTKKTLSKIPNLSIYLKLIGEKGLVVDDNELSERLKRLRKVRSSAVSAEAYENTTNKEGWSSRFLLQHARYEAFRWLKTNPDKQLNPEAFLEVLLATITEIDDHRFEQKVGNVYVSELEDLLKKKFLLNAEINSSLKNLDSQQLALSYAVYEKYGYFRNHPEIRSNTYDNIISRELTKLMQKGEAKPLRDFTETILYGCSIQSVNLRKKLIEGWSKSIKIQHGSDLSPAFKDVDVFFESNNFQKEILAITDEVIEKTSGFLHEEMLEKLADTLETQSQLTGSIFMKINLKNKKMFEKNSSGNKGSIGELGLDFFTFDEKLRLATIDFFTSELTDENLDAFLDVIENRKKYYLSSLERRERSGFDEKLETYFNFGSGNQINLTDKATKEKIKAILSTSHDNFWSSKIEFRTYGISMLIFPVNRIYTKPEEIEKDISYIIDKVLPIDKKVTISSNVNRYAILGRDLIYSYIEGISDAEKRLLLSALLVSAKTMGNKPRDEKSIGMALASTLCNMGPAGVKLAQAIHSFPNTPEAIRDGMMDVKGKANIPNRKQLFDRLEEVVPGNNNLPEKLSLNKISHVGSLIGAGAYQYTTRVTLKEPIQSYSEAALTVLRENIYTFAKNEYSHILTSLESFKKRRQLEDNDNIETLIDSIREVIMQAETMSILETDYDIGARQSAIIKPQYEDLTITSNGQVVKFATVDWLDHSSPKVQKKEEEDIQAYVLLGIAPGISFNQFAKATKKKELVNLSLAIQLAEDIMTLSGRNFDHDRHGENFNVLLVDDSTQIGKTTLQKGDILVTHYDLGTVNLELATEREKEIIGIIIVSALVSSTKNNKNFSQELIKEIVGYLSVLSGTSNFLLQFLRSILARGDIVRYLSPNDIKQEAIALIRSNIIDKKIMETIIREFMTAGEFDILEATTFYQSTANVQVTKLPKIFSKN
jgi:hypothetical protein